jgi:PQQ-like domain
VPVLSRCATSRHLLAATVAAVLVLASSGCATWTTYGHDAARSGVDPSTGSPVAPTQLWQTPALDGAIYGQPLIFGSRVYVATENDSVYALDASTGAIVWQRSAGTAVPAGQLPCGDISPTVGITSTPVIDPVTERIYVVADAWDGSNASSIAHHLVGFGLADGAPAPGLPVTVEPPGSTAAAQLQRAALALDGSEIVIGYGGNAGDCSTYHGWLVGSPEAGGGPLRTFEADAGAGDRGGAIWGSGDGPAVDTNGDIFVATGNGFLGTYDGSESVFKLDPSLAVLDHYTPANWLQLDQSDLDIGSTEPLLLPGGLVFQIGKAGVGYLLSANHLGGTGGTGNPAEPSLFHADVCSGSYGGSVYASGVIYVPCADGLHALSLNTTAPSFAPALGWTVPTGAIGPPIIAGGLVWDAARTTGQLVGLDPTTGAVKFSSNLGTFEHFSSPSAGDGRLFVANGDKVTALNIATPPSSATTTTRRSESAAADHYRDPLAPRKSRRPAITGSAKQGRPLVSTGGRRSLKPTSHRARSVPGDSKISSAHAARSRSKTPGVQR